ncbi:MAG: hypothetical protein WD053_01850 [Gracilimonas sp.]
MKHFVIIVSVALLTFACTSEQGADTRSIHLEEQNSFVLKPDSLNLFGSFDENFKINKKGDKVAFSDRIKEKVFVFDDEGNFVQVYGENNKGPNGIISVDGYDFARDGRMVILDLKQSLLKIFDSNGTVIKSSSVFENTEFYLAGSDFILYEDVIYLPILEGRYANSPDSSNLIGKMDLDGNFVDSFGSFDPFLNEDKQYLMENMFEISESGIIYTNLSSSYRINSYQINNNSYIESFGTEYPSFSLPQKDVKFNLSIPEINNRMTGVSLTNSIHSTSDYFIKHVQILTEEWFKNVNSEDKYNFLVIYDLETKEFLGEINIHGTLGAVHENQLYIIEDFNPDNYTVGIYELVEKGL